MTACGDCDNLCTKTCKEQCSDSCGTNCTGQTNDDDTAIHYSWFKNL